MSYDTYRERLNANSSGLQDAHTKATIDVINANFADSLGYTTVTVDGSGNDVVFQFGKTQDDRIMLFRPKTSVLRGSMIVMGTDTWLVTDTESNTLYPKATVLKCNHLIKWDSYTSLAVVQSNARAYGLQEGQMIDLPRGEYTLFVPYNDSTKIIREDTRFVINGHAYNVIGLDNITQVINSKGVLTIHIKDDLNRTSDDLVGGVADQTPSGGGWTKW